jgi:ATP-dependent helicase HrpA
MDSIPDHRELIVSDSALPLRGFPALCVENTTVALRIFPDRDTAESAHEQGVILLLRRRLAELLVWAEHDLRIPKDIALRLTPYIPSKQLNETLFALAESFAFQLSPPLPRTREEFENIVAAKKEELRNIGHRIIELLDIIVHAYDTNRRFLEKMSAKYSSGTLLNIARQLEQQLQEYMQRIFAPGFSYSQLIEYPRYFRALRKRIESAFLDPAKYRTRMKQLAPFIETIHTIKNADGAGTIQQKETFETFILMVEEYAISLFAQQSVKTKHPVTQKKLFKAQEQITTLFADAVRIFD